MSDRSFGDYPNRSVVKNPLLSTAVTGLSIEDLTQNAVLLPAVPSQELITRQDERIGTQMRSLGHSQHDITVLSAGDTNSNQTQQPNIPTHILNPINNNKNTQNDKINEMHTVSKATAKSTDDFDVNEYFARLQGTRYVSAPLNSNVSDQNANLQAEENLEEINLNDTIEPDKEHNSENIQQSITADIAQNFSQLPNVLPHVASAVFSSFSNMLSLKSREVTPDETKVHHDVQHQPVAAVNMPFAVPEAPASIAPPPLREPPMTGTTSNYRITTKKKVYAQVPGLSSGDNHHMQTLNPGPSSLRPPSYFTPDAIPGIPYDESNVKNVPIGYDMKPYLSEQISNVKDDVDKDCFYKPPQTTAKVNENKIIMTDTTTPNAEALPTDKTILDAQKGDEAYTGTTRVPTQVTPEEAKQSFDLFNPTPVVPKEKKVESRTNLPCSTIPDFATENQPAQRQNDANSVQLEKPHFPSQPSSSSSWFSPVNDSRFMGIPPQGSSAVIPPPPMFSNIPRRDSQTTIEKSVLPPSVARRISGNQPIIKPQAVPMVVKENFFIPTIPFESETHSQQNMAPSEYSYLPDSQNTAQYLTTDKSECIRQPQINRQTQPIPPENNPQSSFQIAINNSNKSVDLSLPNTSVPMISSNNCTLPGVRPFTQSSFTTEAIPLQIFQLSSEPKHVSDDTVVKSEGDSTPSLFQKSSNERLPNTTDITQQLRHDFGAPSMFTNPATQTSIPKTPREMQINEETVSQDKFSQFMINSPPQLPKEISEPPKMTGNLNYRLKKKKPQYYSGPIAGVGNISNNVKPILNTMGPSSFQGAIFTPESNEDPTSQKLASDYNVASAHEIASSADLPKPPTGSSSFQGAYFTPDQNVQPCNQKISSDYSLPRAYDGATSFDSNQTTASSYPFNINEPEERKPLVCNAFNTAFDLSRPTTESFDDTQRESKGFGIIGSLKSKLSSIDINKIQNTVTTFFDPAYNNTKSEEKKQEHLTHYDNDLSVGNYRNFPQTENANLEVYIPNEQITPNVYNQHPNSSQPSMHPQYYPSQEYLNQAQNHPNFNYTGWDGTQSGTTNLFPNLHNVMQDSSSRNMPMSLIEVQEMYPNTATFSQDYTIQTASEKPLKEIENEKTAYLSKLTDSASHSSVHKGTTLSENRKEINIEKINAIPDDKGETKISQNTADTFKTFFDYSKEDSQLLLGKNICRDDITDIKNANPEYGHSTTDSFTSALDIKQSFTEPIVQVKGYERISKLHASRAFSNISAKDFFDRQQSQDNLTTSKLQKSYEDNTEQKPHTGYDLLQKTSDISTKSFFEYQLTNPDRDLSNNKVLQSIFSKENTIDFDTSKEILTTVVLPVLKNISEDLVPPQYLDSGINDSEVISSTSFDNKIIGNNDEATKLSKNSYTLFDFGHSDKPSVIHGCAPYKDVKDIEEKLENVSLTGNTESVLNKKSSVSVFFVKGEPIDLNQDFPVHPDSDLNICETCREVNKPEETDGDNLTTHLIENITAPIQLANPVEYPVVETTKVTDETDISYATESIIETMKLPAPVELIENIISTGINYGWSTNIPHSSNVLQDHNYGFQPDPLSLGCFEDKSLLFENIPTNASDEIKAEYRISQDDTPVLPLINMPAAPPEEDSKSDESCLDVHSIEQDAKKDFPIYEEFVIDPSETDDNKIEYKERERSSDDPIPDADTFTNRVERYKKMETNPEPNAHIFELRKDSIPFDLPTSTSPALTIASYFDTGNYAVENHYRNSLTSPLPSTLRSFTVNTSPPMRIPPGFEEEYKRRLSIAAANILPGFNSQNITYVPDTSTQSASIITLTLNPNIAYVPDVSAQIRGLPTLVYSGSPIEDLNISDAEVKTMAEKISSATNERLPAFSNFVEPKEEIVEEQKHKESIEEKPQNLEQPKLETQTDPINFFTSNEESTDDSDAYNNYSRLSSYFSSPPKPDHSKSFFELSQSQDHYRHKTKNDTFDSIQTNVKSFFETAALNNPSNTSILNSNNETSNIPHNYMQNMSLVNDLTSCKNFTPSDDVVRTVNYFTIAHNAEYAKENCIGEPKVIVANKEHVKITESKETKNNQLGDVPDNNLNFEDIVSNCKYCCETTKNFTKVDFDSVKVRKVMDRNTDTKREGDCSMDEKKDNVGRKGMSVNFANQTFQEDSSDRIVSIDENRTSSDYDPVKYHWFYHVEFEDKSIWRGFSAGDSKALEDAYNSPDLNEETIVATDGGRFDVNVMGRIRTAVYWADKPSNVMRCSWFYKGTAVPRYVPYTESVAAKLEDMYRNSVTTGEWHRRLILPNNEMVVMHGPTVMVHFLQTSTDTFTSTPSMRQRVVRGCVESEIEDTEPSSIDHLLLLCHGVGSACDMRFRSVEEVVDDFRSTSLQLVQAHYRNSYDSGLVGRVEVLPISWHSSLHSGENGVDTRLAAVTLESIPRLRNFTNDTLLDVLFYTSPVFCQTIIDTVCGELNRIYALFKQRNPNYEGGVSLGGHSLGSVILYDLLSHQTSKDAGRQVSTDKQYVTGTAGTGQPCVKYPHLDFDPDALYALGSPIAIFECIRGVHTLGLDFCLPTCKNFFNIFHPYDPIAYRLEPMVNPQLRDVKPYLIPHHKGRKRMHLELKDTMARVGADIKQKLVESIKSTWSSMWKTQPPPDTQLEKVVEEEIEKERLNAECKEDQIQDREITADMLGKLNGGRRIDHVLQEAPFEMINEYLFAMSSHVCYWESEDTMLVMLREIYNAIGVIPDCSVPQHTLTVQRSRIQEDSVSLTYPESPSTSRGAS